MAERRSLQPSESLKLATFLCLAGGLQDAYSYHCRGQVFANAQTGNIVLLGQALATGDWTRALRYLYPLSAFIAGVYIAEWIGYLYRDRQRLHWRQMVLLIEIPLLLIAGVLPQSLNVTANVMMSFACAMQVHSFRSFRGISCATTMCIGNMRGGTECLCRFQLTKDPEQLKKGLLYFYIILVFAIGAAAGAVISDRAGDRSIWVAALFLAVGFCLMFDKRERILK